MSGQDRPTFREAWDSGRPTYGGWCSIPSPLAVELMSRAGFDWLCIDLEHGGAQPADLIPLLQAAAVGSTPAFVRVPWNEPGIIMKALDCGAAGVIVPMISSAEDAARAAGACRYPPAGYRSWGPLRAGYASGYTPERGNRSVLCAVMIETVEAVAGLDEILSVPGLDAVFVGPADLALSAGLQPGLESEDASQADRLRRVVEACAAHGVVPGIYAGPAAPRRREQGFRMLGVATDAGELSSGVRSALAAARAQPETSTTR